MHSGHIDTSDRLKDTMAVLSDNEWHSTWEIMSATKSCAVHSDISGLRSNGIQVECKRDQNNPRRWIYRVQQQMEMAI